MLGALLTLGASVPAAATERYVPSEYPTIQAAVDACVDGDVVIVADDTYTGPGNTNIKFFGKAITVRSENGPENCIIDCEGSTQSGFYLQYEEGPASIVDGFTVTNSCST